MLSVFIKWIYNKASELIAELNVWKKKEKEVD